MTRAQHRPPQDGAAPAALGGPNAGETAPSAAAPIEILAPVGGPECLAAAVWAGADSVYLGLQGLNARRGADNFTPQQLQEAVAFCHGNGVRAYVTLNTLVHSDELPAVCRALQAVCDAGADALLVQDWAVAALARQWAPGLALHASTQLAVTDLAGACLAARLGFARVVLARELAGGEIAHIAAHCGIETEVFVHGAQCMSVSGQCYLSAFLGGRSGNRGGCAQPCRLPCTAFLGQTPPAGPPKTHHLSLKDMSALDHLPQLQAMGVTSVKIEGRLRPPEYVAAAVHAACQARAGRPYDRAQLEQVFSRSGFTDGYFAARRDAALFGVRRPEDLAATRAAEPGIRQLYRRPLARVPVALALTLAAEGAKLTAGDGRQTATVYTQTPPAADPPGPAYPAALRRSLAKTGGTPFYVPEEQMTLAGADRYFLPLSEVNTLRRRALDALFQKRAAAPGAAFLAPQTGLDAPDKIAAALPADLFAVPAVNIPAAPAAPVPAAAAPPAAAGAPAAPVVAASVPAAAAAVSAAPLTQGRRLPGGQRLIARLESPDQLPPALADTFAAVLLPLRQLEKIPPALAEKTVLELPRGGFGDTGALAARMAAAARRGFCRFEANAPGHLWQLAQLAAAGLPVQVWGGFPLNILNPVAARQLAALGVRVQTLSCEVRLDELPAFAGAGPAVTLLGYGRLPVMLTRACPLQHVTDCANCPRRGQLLDRKGQTLPVLCRGTVREIYNPVPLWLGDRQHEARCDAFTLYFTWESAARVQAVTQAFCQGQGLPGRFTRGLYYAPRTT